MAMTMTLKRMGHADITVHGFRSTFRDWAGVRAFFREFPWEAPPLTLDWLQNMGILSRQNIGSTELRRLLHDQLFKD
jgi:hypothetical protein